MNTKKIAPKKTKTVVAKKVAAKIVKKTKISATKKSPIKSKSSKKIVKVATKKISKKSKTISASRKFFEIKRSGRAKDMPIKRIAYMTLSIILGLLIGLFVKLFLELVYMKNAMAVGATLKTNYFLGSPSYLPQAVQPLLLMAGLLLGIWIGLWGWEMVYVQHRHRMFRK